MNQTCSNLRIRPTEEYAATSKELFYWHLRKTIKISSFKIVIGADMNATVGKDSEGEWPCIGRNNDELATNDNGSRLLNLCQELSLFPLNTVFQSKRIHRDTWYSPTGFSKRNDYIIGEWYVKRFSKNCRVYSKASLPYDSDHRLLVAEFTFPSNALKKKLFHPKKNPKKPHLDIKKLRVSETVIKEFSTDVESLLENPPHFENTEMAENYIVTALNDASKATIHCKE